MNVVYKHSLIEFIIQTLTFTEWYIVKKKNLKYDFELILTYELVTTS